MNSAETTVRDEIQLGDGARRAVVASAVVGLVGLGAAAALAAGGGEDGWHRFFSGWVVNFAFFLSLALGGLFFVMLQHVTLAGWSVVVRRVAEAIATTFPLLALLAIPLVAGTALGWHHLYHWADPEAVAHDPILAHKAPYLNTTFLVIRWVVFFAVWIGYSTWFHRTSLQQDRSGDPAATLAMQRHSAHGIILYALTQSFAAFDMLMSLDAHWFSTIFGVYYFAGSNVALYASLAVSLYLLQRRGFVRESVTREHYHDVGKLLFGFTVFWAYIAFSQYMLIWYGNIPEETEWFLKRQTGAWVNVSVLLILGHFFLPFFAILSRHTKRAKGWLVGVAVWMLAMHWVDMLWLARPETAPPGELALGPIDAALFVGMGGLFVAATVRRLARGALVPVKDPRLAESLAFENV